jgi:hypothetical protein
MLEVNLLFTAPGKFMLEDQVSHNRAGTRRDLLIRAWSLRDRAPSDEAFRGASWKEGVAGTSCGAA